MYHISSDKRSRQSAELIYKGLLECLEEKPFDLVTISDVQRESGVARTTFYRSFDNMSDVLFWQCDIRFHEVLAECDPLLFANEITLARHYFSYWTQHSEILELLVRINRQDIIYACHMKNANILQESFGALPDLPMEHGNYFIAIRTGFTISMLTTWLRGGKKETPDELVGIVVEQLKILARETLRD